MYVQMHVGILKCEKCMHCVFVGYLFYNSKIKMFNTVKSIMKSFPRFSQKSTA